MLEETIRPGYQRLLVDPVVRRIGFSFAPTDITLLAGGLGLLFIPVLLFVNPVAAVIILLISGYCDTLDGSLARYQNKATSLGSVIDIMVDRFVEFSVIFGLYLVSPAERALAVIMMLGSILLCITSFLVVGIFTHNHSHKSFHYSPGLMERAEAFFFFILMALMPNYFNWLAWLFTGLVLITALIRFKQFTESEQALSYK